MQSRRDCISFWDSVSGGRLRRISTNMTKKRRNSDNYSIKIVQISYYYGKECLEYVRIGY